MENKSWHEIAAENLGKRYFSHVAETRADLDGHHIAINLPILEELSGKYAIEPQPYRARSAEVHFTTRNDTRFAIVRLALTDAVKVFIRRHESKDRHVFLAINKDGKISLSSDNFNEICTVDALDTYVKTIFEGEQGTDTPRYLAAVSGLIKNIHSDLTYALKKT